MTGKPPKPPHVYECEGCEWIGIREEMECIASSDERVAAGELMVAGECPDCGDLIGVADADVPNYTLQIVANIMRARGWMVEEPPK